MAPLGADAYTAASLNLGRRWRLAAGTAVGTSLTTAQLFCGVCGHFSIPFLRQLHELSGLSTKCSSPCCFAHSSAHSFSRKVLTHFRSPLENITRTRHISRNLLDGNGGNVEPLNSGHSGQPKRGPGSDGILVAHGAGPIRLGGLLGKRQSHSHVLSPFSFLSLLTIVILANRTVRVNPLSVFFSGDF